MEPLATLWLDLETTGLAFENPVLEIGAVLTRTEYPWEELSVSRFSALIMPNGGINIARLDPVVLDMHAESGLLGDIRRHGRYPGHVADSFAEWVQDSLKAAFNVEPRENILQLAGSGVAAFDIHVLRKQFPIVASWLHYATLDVGQVRRFAKAAGIELVKPDGPQSGDEKAHRAMADVLDHLSEARAYAAQLLALQDSEES